jgi:hypothetical protein
MLWSWRLLYAQHVRYRHTFKALLVFESELKSDYAFFIERVFARDVEAAVNACLENYEKVAQFVERNEAADAALGGSAKSLRNEGA